MGDAVTALQELLTDGGEYVDPAKPEKPREARVLIPKSRLLWYEREFKEITKHYDSSETNSLERRLWALWETFKGTRK